MSRASRVETGAAALDSPPRAASGEARVLSVAPSPRPRWRRRGWLVRRMLMAADVVGLTAAFALVVVIFSARVGPTDPVARDQEIALFLLTLPAWILLSRLHGLYDRDEERASHSTLDDLVGVFHLVTIGAFLFFAGAWVSGLADPYPPKLLTFWLLAIALVAVARVGARTFARTRRAYVQNAVIVGVDPVAKLVARKLIDQPGYGITVVGFIDPAAARNRRRRGCRRCGNARAAFGDRLAHRRRARHHRVFRASGRGGARASAR